METRTRSILKALTWRAGALAITVSAAWVVTGRAGVAASIGVLDTAVKLLAFYLHERAWLRVRFGKVEPPEYQI